MKSKRMITMVVNINEESYKFLEIMAKHNGTRINDFLAYCINYRWADWVKQDKEWND